MTTTRCERDAYGREIGVIEHNGREFKALGASVVGTHVSGYVGKRDELLTWCGRTMLDCRSDRGDEYRDEYGEKSFGLVFLLGSGRAIVGYALGVGMLFRGELVQLGEGNAWDEARDACKSECDYWRRIDAEDAERFQAELDAEDEDAE